MTLLRVFAHHKAVPPAFGAMSTVTSGVPAMWVYWAELDEQATINAEGLGPPVISGTVAIPGGGTIPNVAKPVDDGFAPATNFSLARVWVVAVSRNATSYDYTLIA